MPCVIALRVVSLPATTKRIKKLPNSWLVSRSPSTTACIITLVRSSVGFASRASPSAWAYENMPMAASINFSKLPPKSGSPAPKIVFVHSNICRSSSAGMPIISQIICNGNRAAIASTKSNSWSANSSMTESIIVRAFTFTYSSMRAISRGVKPFETIERSRKCFGSSMLIIEPKNSLSSCERSMMFEPLPLQKSCGLRLTCQMSSWRVSAM